MALTYYFQKAGNDSWNVYVAANGTPIATSGGNPAPSTTITFPTNGGSPTAPVGTVAIDIPSVTNAAGATTVPITGVKLDVSGATEYGSEFGVTDLKQDGYASGQLIGVQFEADGTIDAKYSNGQTKRPRQLELATFRNPQGLQPTGGNSWIQSVASGAPIVGTPGSGNLGVLQAGALEESNVDLSSELVNMITAQRDYQANAQTIKTEDQILQTIVNLKPANRPLWIGSSICRCRARKRPCSGRTRWRTTSPTSRPRLSRRAVGVFARFRSKAAARARASIRSNRRRATTRHPASSPPPAAISMWR